MGYELDESADVEQARTKPDTEGYTMRIDPMSRLVSLGVARRLFEAIAMKHAEEEQCKRH